MAKQLSDLPEIDGEIDETSDYYKRNVVPVDRGYAWVVCFGGFLVYFVFGISNQTLVVLFVELIHMYDTTVTMGSLIFMFSVFSVGFMSIISTNFLAPRYGERTVVSVAGLFNMCGTLGLSFSPTIGAFIVMSVLKGLATGAVFVPSISLIRLYFQNRRSIAQIMANVGQSAAVIIVPPAIRIIRKHYGISGTFIVIAGIELHMTVAGLLLRPISAYRFRPRLANKSIKVKAMEEVLISEDYNEFKFDPKYAQNKTFKMLMKGGSKADVVENPEVIQTTKSDDVLPEGDRTSNADENHKSNDGLLKHNEKRDSDRPEKHISIDKSAEKNGEKRHGSDYSSGSRGSKTSRKSYIQGIREMSVFIDTVEEKTERRWLFRMVLLATIPGSANLYVRNYVPTLAQGQGATSDESAMLLTIVGAVDLMSRLCIGLFADTHLMTSVQIIIITQLCLASVCHCLRFFTDFNSLIIYAVLIGLFVGTRISVTPLLAMEIVGVDNMPQALSFISTIGALSSALMNPIFGSVAERDGNFVLVMNLVGGCFTLSSLIMIAMPPIILLRRYLLARRYRNFLTGSQKSDPSDVDSDKTSTIRTMGSNVDTLKKLYKSHSDGAGSLEPDRKDSTP